MKQYITEDRAAELKAEQGLSTDDHVAFNAAIADWINSQSGELPEHYHIWNETKFYTEDQLREAIAAAKWKSAEQEQEPVAMGSLLQKIMARLADLLDDDKFNEIDGIVTAAGYNYPMPSQQAAHAVPKASQR